MSKSNNQTQNPKTDPWHWKDYANSDDWAEIKVERAKHYGVAAVIFTAEQVKLRIDQMAAVQATRIAKETPTERAYIAVLHGAAPVVASLGSSIAMNHPDSTFIVRYIRASRYGSKQTGKQVLDIKQDIEATEIAGKDITLVDEVYEEGHTMELLAERFIDKQKFGARSVSGFVLCDKMQASPREELFKQFDRGLIIPQVWGSGMGMDDPNEKHRWTPDILISDKQEKRYKEVMAEILDDLGDLAVMGIDDITWL